MPVHISGALALAWLECQKSVTRQIKGTCNELSSVARPRSRPSRRGRGKDGRRVHHPGYRQGKAQEGEVVAAGTGAKAEDGKVTPLDVKAGDRILFGKWSGTEVKVNGEDLLIMKESDILGIIG